MRILLFTFLSQFSISSFAAPLKVTAVSGASTVQYKGSPIISGALAGQNCGSGTNTTCNSCNIPTCSTAPLCACSEVRVHDLGLVEIQLNHRSKGLSPARMVDANNVQVPIQNFNNDGKSISVRWGDICATMGVLSCEALTSISYADLKIYIDSNVNGVLDANEETVAVTFKAIKPSPSLFDVFGAGSSDGISNFALAGGNRKIYLEDLEASISFPYLPYGNVSTRATNLVVYLSDKNMTEAQPGAGLGAEYLPISTKNGPALSKSVVEGLDNGTRYFVRIALMDEGGNIVQFFPGPGVADCDTGGPQCPYSITTRKR